MASFGITEQDAQRAIDDLLSNDASGVTATRGGTITYWGSEVGSGVALYQATERIFCQFVGPRTLGYRNVESERPKHGKGRGEGTWTRPDLVVWADPRRRRSARDPRQVHALEVERTDGFGIQSVYQAYEQGRGANYCWVFAHADSPSDRIVNAAEDLGVGLVTFTNPASWKSYRLDLPARYREFSAAAREEFHTRCRLVDRR